MTSSISILMSYDRPEIVRHIEMINVVYLVDDDSIEFICNPFQFLPLCVDHVNLSSNARFFEPTEMSYPLRGTPVIKLINLLVIAIGWSSQIFLSWYQRTMNLMTSSFKAPNLFTMGAFRYDLILVAVIFLALSHFNQSLISTQ